MPAPARVPAPRPNLQRPGSICSKPPDPRAHNGSATGLTIPPGPRSRVAVKLRRNEAIQADSELEWSSRAGNTQQTPRDLPLLGPEIPSRIGEKAV